MECRSLLDRRDQYAESSPGHRAWCHRELIDRVDASQRLPDGFKFNAEFGRAKEAEIVDEHGMILDRMFADDRQFKKERTDFRTQCCDATAEVGIEPESR